ncbi:MAG: glycosyltransferase family 87 protein [Sphingomonadales bacterium]
MNRDRVMSYALILVVVEVLILIFFVLGTHGKIVELGGPVTTDFASFYGAGLLAVEGTPALVYDQTAHLDAIRRVTAPEIDYLLYYYPPVFLLVCAAFAVFPYLPAFYLFVGVTFAAYAAVGRAILQEKGALGWVLLLASPAVYWAAGLGQNSFLTAAAFGAGLLLVDRRPFLAGVLLGLICYKPHFGLLIPVALAAGGHWRAFMGAAVSVLALIALSMLLFGWQTWHDFLVLFTGATGSYEHGDVDLAAFITPFGGARLIGVPVSVAYGIQIACALGAAVVVGWIWRGKANLAVRAAALCAAVPVAVHVALMYDMLLGALAVFWLVRAARDAGGFMPWEKTILALVFIAPMFSRLVGHLVPLPVGPIAQLALLAVVVARARLEFARDRAARAV